MRDLGLFLCTLVLSTLGYAQERTDFNLKAQIGVYTDCLGRTTLEPANREECLKQNYDTNNALLYTGELVILLQENEGIPADIKNKVLEFLPRHFVKPGLLSRHPEPYRFTRSMKPISFDEFTGVGFMAAVIPELRTYLDQVVEYGEDNYWQYWDVPGHEKGRSWYDLLYPKSLIQWIPYLQEDSLRKSTIRYPELYPVFATHHFHQRAFYKMMSKSYKPNWFEELYFVAASVLSEDKDNYSSLAMWLFRYKALEHREYKSSIVNWAKERWRKKMTSRYGQKYNEVIFNLYYENDNHPFHAMAKMKNDSASILPYSDKNEQWLGTYRQWIYKK